MITFSEQVKILLDRKKMSVSKLAEKVGTTRQNMNQKLKENSFDIYWIQKIAHALDTNVTISFDEFKEDFGMSRIINNIDIMTDEIDVKESNRTNYNTTAVNQYDLDGNFIAHYAGLREAARALGKQSSAIIQCSNGIRQSAYGYKWIKASEDKNWKGSEENENGL